MLEQAVASSFGEVELEDLDCLRGKRERVHAIGASGGCGAKSTNYVVSSSHESPDSLQIQQNPSVEYKGSLQVRRHAPGFVLTPTLRLLGGFPPMTLIRGSCTALLRFYAERKRSDQVMGAHCY